MPLTQEQKTNIERTIIDALRDKFENYEATADAKPFHTRLLGINRLAKSSFIHGLYTNFGTTIFEPVAVAIASPHFANVRHSVKAGTTLSSDAQLAIESIMNELSAARAEPDKESEIARIRDVCQSGELNTVKLIKHDLFLESRDGDVYLIDIKTAKPNKEGFEGLKRKLLKWCAAYLYENPEATVHSIIAIPYNPYEPEPYNPSTARGIMDLSRDLLVAEAFWNFLANDDIYDDLLECFERAGITMQAEIDDYFERFN